MRIKSSHLPYICSKIVVDLLACGLVRFSAGEAPVAAVAEKVLAADLAKEARLDARVDELLAEKEADIELMQADEKVLFYMSKAHLAAEFGVIMNADERHQYLAGAICDALIEADAINFSVNALRVRNVIFKAITDYLAAYDEIDDIVYEKIKNSKRKLIFGTEEYEIVYQKLYTEELAKRGIIASN